MSLHLSHSRKWTRFILAVIVRRDAVVSDPQKYACILAAQSGCIPR